MPHLDHKGPEGSGSGTGRKLGNCLGKTEPELDELGVGMGLKRKSGGGTGKAKRLKSSKIFNNQNNSENENCDTNKR